MSRRIPVSILLTVALFALAGTAGAAGTADGGDAVLAEQPVLADEHVDDCAATPPEDHADPDGDSSEVVGWVEGYWYNEPVALTPDDGFNQTELERLSKRTAARVEALRCLTYEEIPPLQSVSREEYQDDLEQTFEEEVTAEGELFANAQLATRLTVGQNEDAIQTQIETRAAAPAAFYDTEEEYMAFVTDDDTVEDLDQTTLAHELTHALQDQHFNLAEVFEEPTNDRYLSSAGVVEGDADLVQELYRENCGDGWNDECLIPEQGEPPEVPNWSLLLNQLSLYEFPLVDSTYDSEGLEGVDDLFGAWPNTTTETINPDLYESFEPADVTVEDQSSGDWRRVQSGNLSYETVGQAGMTAMLMAPTYGSGGVEAVISDPSEFQPEAGVIDYGITETQGWQGDKLYGYADGENRTAGVWESTWETETDAEEFASGYEALAEYRDGALADGYENVYTFEDSESYEMAAAIQQDGETVTIVTAPTVEELTAVHEDIELQESDGDEDDESSDDDGAGFGLVVAALALLAVALSAWTRRR